MVSFLILKKNIDSLIAAAAGFAIIFLFTRHGGIGICPDGVAYTTTAENFKTTGQFVDFTNSALVDFPLLYPLFLSFLSLLTNLKPLTFAPILNATLFSFLIYTSGCMMEQFSYRSKLYKIAILSCILLSPCLLEVYSMLWSETLFIILLMWFIVMLNAYFKTHSTKLLIAVAIISAFSSVTRYAGVTIIGTGGILLLLDMKIPLRGKIHNILIYSAISPVLLIINLARNFSVSGTLMGLRERSIRSFWENTSEAGSVLYNWLPFSEAHNTGAALLMAFLVIVLIIACIHQFVKHRCLTSYQNIAAVFSLVFLLFMLMSASLSRFEEMDSRLLSPLFIPLLWFLSNWLVYVCRNINYKQRKWIVALGTFFLVSFQYGQLKADYETWDGVKDAGIPGYTENDWKYSETVQYIEKDSLPFKKDYTIYSNAYDAIHFFTGRSGKFLPHKEFKEDVDEFLKDSHCYMVWFNDGYNPDLVGMPFIIQIKKMKLVKQFSDGAIYEYDKG